VTKVKTNCKGCIFAEEKKHHLGTKESTQVGCSLERHNLLGVEELDDEGDFVLKRYCNTYRPEEWVQDLDFEEALNPEETVLEEVFPRVGFFIRLDTDDPDVIEALDTTIESITQLAGEDAAYVAVVTDKVEYNVGIWESCVKHFTGTTTKYHVVQSRELESKEDVLDEAFSHAQNGWVYSTSAGELVPSDILHKLHELLNIKMEQLVMVEPYDGLNGLMFPAFLFKFLKGNKAKLFQDQTVSSGTFIEKIKNAQKRDQASGVLTWEEFNAS
tara:strand:- start:218 stop:1033 length:816 start_codon:yes stop_codon:yes gene_type:complete